MPIINESKLLSEKEKETYERLLKAQGYKPEHFLLEVYEDQASMDMNDLSYVIIVNTKATHLKHQKTRTYRSRAGSGAWLTDFEKDLKSGFFV